MKSIKFLALFAALAALILFVWGGWMKAVSPGAGDQQPPSNSLPQVARTNLDNGSRSSPPGQRLSVGGAGDGSTSSAPKDPSKLPHAEKFRSTVLSSIVSEKLVRAQLNLEEWKCSDRECLASLRMPVHAGYADGRSPHGTTSDVLQELQEKGAANGVIVGLSKLQMTDQGTLMRFSVSDARAEKTRTLTESEIARIRSDSIREHEAQKEKFAKP